LLDSLLQEKYRKMAMFSQIMSTNLPLTLSSSSNIPTDVKFVFKVEAEDNNTVKEVNAHKLILALVSDVFEKEFFGALKEVENIVEIKDAEQEVFQAMIDCIYNKQIDISMHGFRFLGKLFYLAEKYCLSALQTEIIKVISKKKICDENIFDVVAVAEENVYHELFSETLYERVAKYLLGKFAGNFEIAINFFSQAEAIQVDDLVLSKVTSKMKNVKLPVCYNCKSCPCLDGEGVTKDNFVPEAKVVNRNGNGSAEVDKLLRVIDHMNQFVARTKNGKTVAGYTLNPAYYMYKCVNRSWGPYSMISVLQGVTRAADIPEPNRVVILPMRLNFPVPEGFPAIQPTNLQVQVPLPTLLKGVSGCSPIRQVLTQAVFHQASSLPPEQAESFLQTKIDQAFPLMKNYWPSGHLFFPP